MIVSLLPLVLCTDRTRESQNSALKKWKKSEDLTGVPLVLHGGTGIPTKDIQKAISLGTAKINVNTENQIAQTKKVREVLAANPEIYDPRKYLGPARDAIKETVLEKSVNSVHPERQNNIIVNNENRLRFRRRFRFLYGEKTSNP